MSPISPEIMLKIIADQQAEIIALKKLLVELSTNKLTAQQISNSDFPGYFAQVSGSLG